MYATDKASKTKKENTKRRVDLLVGVKNLEPGHTVDRSNQNIRADERPCKTDQGLHNLDRQLLPVAIEEDSPVNFHATVRSDLLLRE